MYVHHKYTLIEMYPLAIRLGRPVILATIGLHSLEKQQLPETQLVVLGLGTVHVGHYGVNPPHGVTLYHTQRVEKLLELWNHRLLAFLIAGVRLANEHVSHQHARAGNEIGQRKCHAFLCGMEGGGERGSRRGRVGIVGTPCIVEPL